MSAPFSFPPPPPPPPKAASGIVEEVVQNQSHGGRGGRGGYRGRGRGNPYRGNSYGGYSGHNYQGSSGGVGYEQQQPMTGQPGYLVNYPQQPQGYPQQHQNYAQHPYQQQYPQHMYPAIPSSQAPYQTPYAYPNQGYGQMSYAAAGQYPNQAAYSYPAQDWSQPMHSRQSPPPQMGPPIRLGFDHGHNPQSQNLGNYQVSLQGQASLDNKRKRDGNHDSRGTSNNGRFQRGNNSNTRPQKRSKVEAAPAVPSFGTPLPRTAPLVNSTSNDTSSPSKRKKRRKKNQLGLTPAGEEHESSEEEVDDEALFAVAGGPMEIVHHGKTSTLSSAADIAAWVEERKKKFPTKARVEAKKAEQRQQWQEQAEARKRTREAQAEARKKAQEAQVEARGTASIDEETLRAASLIPDVTGSGKKETTADDKTKKSLERHLAKAEKLRKKLEKSQARIAKAAATIAGLSQPQNHLPVEAQNLGTTAPDTESTTELIMSPATGTDPILDADSALPEVAAIVSTDVAVDADIAVEPLQALEDALEASLNSKSQTAEAVTTQLEPNVDESAGNANIATVSSITSDSDSSSMSESSSDESDSASDSSPEETSTKPAGPVRVPPPKREPTKRVCRNFLAGRHCKMGERCPFKHELPERGAGTHASNGAKTNETKKEKQSVAKQPARRNLFTVLVEKEQAVEDELVLKAIKYLGQNGHLSRNLDIAE